MCKFAEYLPDENQYEPCHECDDCMGITDTTARPIILHAIDVEEDNLPF